MVKFIPIAYHGCTYPAGVFPHIWEVAAHFGKSSVPTGRPFSLHTEYSAGRRAPSALTQRFPALCQSYERGIPLLWTSEAWAADFAGFVRALCAGVPPTILEIHPPYRDTCTTEQFFHRYAVFESSFRQWAPDTPVVLENRTGNLRSRPFLLSTGRSFLDFSDRIDASGCRLRLAFDVPQLLTAHKLLSDPQRIPQALADLLPIRHNIRSIHLWGCNPKAHWGDFNTTFGGDAAAKSAYLAALHGLLDDGALRYLVPEVNSGQRDFLSILGDLQAAGFTFC